MSDTLSAEEFNSQLMGSMRGLNECVPHEISIYEPFSPSPNDVIDF